MSPSDRRLLASSLTVHALLPLGLTALAQVSMDAMLALFLGIHFGFPILLLLGIRWWWARRAELAVLLVLNHLVTFAVIWAMVMLSG